jgi:4-hydroxybenzoate polyprenyltransferase
MAIAIGLLFIAFAFFHSQYRYFHLCVAVVAFIYGYRQFRKRYTPFERRERAMRRKTL